MADKITQSIGGKDYPKESFAYVPDPKKSSTWKLLLYDTDGKTPMMGNVSGAAAAVGPKGYRGEKAKIPAADLPAVKKKIITAYKKLDKKKEEMPAYLFGETPPETFDLEVFKIGDYGEKGEYTEADLEQIATDYNPELHEAPITLDHQQSGPALGWVKRLNHAGGRLIATVGEVSGKLKDLVKAGEYKKRSIEIYKSLKDTGKPYLRALSFLGASPPEVKGLRDFSFNDSPEDVLIFEDVKKFTEQFVIESGRSHDEHFHFVYIDIKGNGETSPPLLHKPVGGEFRSARVVENEGHLHAVKGFVIKGAADSEGKPHTHDLTITTGGDGWIYAYEESATETDLGKGNIKDEGSNTMAKEKQDTTPTEADIKKFTEENTQLKTKIEGLEAEKAKLITEKQKAEISSWLSEKEKGGFPAKIFRANGGEALLLTLAGLDETVTFGEGGEKSSLYDATLKVLDKIVIVKMDETTGLEGKPVIDGSILETAKTAGEAMAERHNKANETINR